MTGVAAYAYRELLARFVMPIYDYTVAEVRRPNDTTVEVSLDPEGDPLRFRPGQFVALAFGGEGGWQRHPFSVASAPSQRRLEVSIKAAGDYTRDLRDKCSRHSARQPGRSAASTTPAADATRSGSQAGSGSHPS